MLRPFFSSFVRLALMTCLTMPLLVARGSAETMESIVNPKRANNSWVNDMARVLDGGAERRLNALLNGLERRTSAEMAVVTIRRTDGSTPKQFATRLFNRWGIGKRNRNNGVLMLLVMDERRIEVETGTGMQKLLPDRSVQQLLTERVVPHFRDDDYAGGIYAGTQALVQMIERPRRTYTANTNRAAPAVKAPLAAPRNIQSVPRGPFDSPADEAAQHSGPPSTAPWWALAGGALLLPAGGWMMMRSRVRHCPQCRAKMRRLDEKEDNAHINFDQLFEENLGSVDYRVWRCDVCQTNTIERAEKWLSGYEDCPKCRHRTVVVQQTVLRQSTYTHSGESLSTRTCRFPNCQYRNQQRHLLPVKPRPSQTHHHHSHSHSSHSSSGGSSSSGSGNFGGGSSRGGGAGASW
ncbi:MAG: uncharacterized protein JWN98_1370 [Abditibacteriota bacterium]|nr:uncharacterized protein [Abditibacteriota bacterium]